MGSNVEIDNTIKRIAVIGMGRSGTSVLTQLMANCGIYAGEGSEKYEHPDGRRINDAILEEMFDAKKILPYGKLPDEEIEVSQHWHSQAHDFIEQMDRAVSTSKNGGMWAFKDPRTTILHKLWLQHFDIIIGIFRHPTHVVESYMAKKWINGLWKRKRALDYWMRFNQSLLLINEEFKSTKQVYIVDFNHDVKAQFIKMCSFIGIDTDEKILSNFDESRGRSQSDVIKDDRAAMVYEKLLSIRNLI